MNLASSNVNYKMSLKKQTISRMNKVPPKQPPVTKPPVNKPPVTKPPVTKPPEIIIKSPIKKYTFIHPTKAGGTAVERYFKKHYSKYITGFGHATKCTNTNNPIIIVRDVKSRFLSMYKYWKHGAMDGVHGTRDKEWIEKYKNTTIKDFIVMLKNKQNNLCHSFTHKEHYYNTCKWINNTDYKNIIVIKYSKNLNQKIQKLLNVLHIPNKHKLLPVINKSVSVEDEHIDLDDRYIAQFIKDYFKYDIILLNAIESKPQLFKLVI